VLTGILTWIANTQSGTLGAMAMGAFSLGLGFPFFLVGAFAVQLPKGGRWMVHIKSLLGIVLIVVALYFASLHLPVLAGLAPAVPWFYGVALGAMVLGVLIGAIHRDFAEPGAGNRAAKGVGVALVSVAAFLSITALARPARTLSWEQTDFVAAREKALSESRPLLVDFTATWCVACKELDKFTFSDPHVEREAGRFVAVKVDATDDEDPKVVRAMSEFKVVGLPTVILYDSEGTEAARFNDFVKPESFLDALQSVN
jgi:thiol:disulfide interchange protein DsbD